MPLIYTIGHSTRPIEVFLSLLKEHGVLTLADIRHYPGSRRYPHFNQESLESELQAEGIRYVHLVDLGGRRKPVPGSVNDGWRVEAFRGYADHMGTAAFRAALQRLCDLAHEAPTAMMCSEALWWQCHRRLVSDRLTADGWEVLHIMAKKAERHRLMPPATLINGMLNYSAGSPLF